MVDPKSHEYSELINRICKNILPRIYHELTKLTLDHISMEHVLHTFNFPQLHSLTLVLSETDTFVQYLKGM
jgi:hypothetical protein